MFFLIKLVALKLWQQIGKGINLHSKHEGVVNILKMYLHFYKTLYNFKVCWRLIYKIIFNGYWSGKIIVLSLILKI